MRTPGSDEELDPPPGKGKDKGHRHSPMPPTPWGQPRGRQLADKKGRGRSRGKGKQEPHPSGTLGYLTINGTLLSGNHVEVTPIAQQELLNGALIVEPQSKFNVSENASVCLG